MVTDKANEKSQKVTVFGRLDELRTKTGATWDQIAEQIGVDRSMFFHVKAGKRQLSGKALYQLAEAEQRAGIRRPEDTTMGELSRRRSTTPELRQRLEVTRRMLREQRAFITTLETHAHELEDWVEEITHELTARGEQVEGANIFLPPDVASNKPTLARKEKRARRPAGSLTDVAAVSVGLHECPAGGPLSPAHRIGEVLVNPGRWDAADLFALRLVGDSMDRAGLITGDVVLCVWAERREAETGDIVVAHLRGDGCTLKRLHGPEGGRWLEPESNNPLHQRITLDGEGEPQAVIQAVMLRKL